MKLFFVTLLLAIKNLGEDEALQEIDFDILLVEGAGIDGELAYGFNIGFIKAVHRLK